VTLGNPPLVLTVGIVLLLVGAGLLLLATVVVLTVVLTDVAAGLTCRIRAHLRHRAHSHRWRGVPVWRYTKETPTP
jgi:hypothetical protein